MSRSPLAEAHARMHDEALAHALALRRQAIDELWRGAGAALTDAATLSLRSSARLLARWRRHRLGKAA